MRVTIIKRYERNFRLPLYSFLKKKLESDGIEFELIIGQLNKYENVNIKDALVENPYGPIIKNKYFYLGRKFISFQNVLSQVKNSNLVIVQQSNSELLNYFLLLKRNIFKNIKLGFWGHGINFQAKNKNSFAQKLKLYLSQYVDHWFAYNKLTYEILIKNGFPKEKISILNNTIDINSEKRIFDSISEIELNNIRSFYGIKENDKIGIFCGSLYKLKRIDFLLSSLQRIKQHYPNFHFFVLGDGELRTGVENFEKNNSDWFHYVGYKTGREKQIYLKLSDFELLPGLVGLNIIDTFYSQTPLITITNSKHSPEIIYLENNYNGIMTNDNINEYIKAVLDILTDENKLNSLKYGCAESAKIYTIENMAENFYQGIIKALG